MMKSIKPGRGPSAMGAIGSIAAGLFGVGWTFFAASIGAPSFFIVFGMIFVGLAIAQGIFHYKNATGKNRMSVLEITDHHTEPDPLNELFNHSNGSNDNHEEDNTTDDINYCPYCGSKISDDFYMFCPNCGKELRK